ncbi:MAG: hypothetical protein CVU44_14255 [Chloroflexi bacterium HGW-Chloroflexi-6]|nr:MAG: hypothetical protein CVU44_14255 [Chloroflexi bacterium HGW-Chloroflexi-6]
MLCPHCGTQWPEELASVLKFCGACGKSMSQEKPVVSNSPEVIMDRANPGGELRYMTVLFADLAGFTAFSEERAADDVANIVGGLLQSLGQVVEQYNGVVDKFLGDAVVATFGAPKPDPNAARNAVRAGLVMQQETERYNTQNGFNFGLRVGIHAGEAMYREIGGAWTVTAILTFRSNLPLNCAAKNIPSSPMKCWMNAPHRWWNCPLLSAATRNGRSCKPACKDAALKIVLNLFSFEAQPELARAV